MKNIDKYNGISLILSTLPLENEEKFIKTQFLDVFAYYKGRMLARNILDDKESQILYTPIIYALFGQYDIVVISFVDDMELTTKTIMPYNNFLKNDSNNQKYKFKIISGIAENESDIKYYLPELFKNRQKNNKYPFFSITNLSYNPLFVVGNGGKADFLIKKKVKSIINDIKANNELDYLLISSFTYNEVTLLLFSNSLQILYKVVKEIRKLTLRDVDPDNELLQNSIAKKIQDSESKDYTGNHIFTNTHSQFGYDINFLINPDIINNKIDKKNNSFRLAINLGLKPGHIFNYYRKLIDKNPELQENVFHSIGKNDILIVLKEKIPFRKYLQLLEIIKEINKDNIDNKDIEHISSTISFDFEKNELDSNVESNNHLSLFSNLAEPYKIEQNDINDIIKKLRALGVSQIHTQQVMSVFSMYNTNLEDFTLFSYFLELYGFVKSLRDRILNTPNYDLIKKRIKYNVDNEIESILKSYIEIFIEAFKNRYSQSFETLDLTEYTVTYKGGIHQLLSGYDAFYKLISSILYGKKGGLYKIAYLSIHKSVKSTYTGIRLNYFHIFQPATYLMIAGHESANFFIRLLIHKIAIKNKDDIVYLKKTGINKENKIKLIYWVNFFNLLRAKTLTYAEKELLKTEKTNIRKNRISFLKSFKEKSLTHDFIFRSGVQWDSFRYLIVDYYSYKFTYFEDLDLFQYWHWVFFMQMPNVYIDFRNLRESDFITMYLRMEVLRKLLDKPNSNLEFFDNEIIPLLGFGYKEKIKLLDTITDDISKNDTIRKAFDFFKDTIDKIYENEKCENAKEKLNDEEFKDKIDFKIPRNSSFEELRQFAMILSYNYLKEIKNIMTEDNTKNLILPRDPRTGEVYNLAVTSGLCINPRGGLFVHGYKTRQNYFSKRIIMMKSLWHISHLLKLKSYEILIEKK